VPSVWITTRITSGGAKRYRVRFRVGGRESPARYAGSFKTMREARERKAWVAGELAALRVPDRRLLEPVPSTSLRHEAERWRESRVDVPREPRRPTGWRSSGL
jgi:hypothetical protein